MSDPHGGPAFPCDFQGGADPLAETPQRGMTLRDWFAGQALAAYQWAINEIGDGPIIDAEIARDCYALADALLAERAAGTRTP